MKYIVKKSVVELPAKAGGIFNTTNIANKDENTYSARIIDELTSITNKLANPTLLAPKWNTSALSVYNGGYFQFGKLVIIQMTVKTNTTGQVKIANVPIPNAGESITGVTVVSATNNSTTFGYVSGGNLNIQSGSASNTYRINGTYICE